MSIGPTGIPGSVVGSSLQQRQGTEIDRAQQETSQQARRTQTERQAEKSAGIGEASQDEGAGDRDADGQRIWEDAPQASHDDADGTETPIKPSKDPTGESGQHLDLNG